MDRTYTLKYSKDIVARAVRSYYYRKLDVCYLIALLLLSGYCLYEVASGDRSLSIGLTGAVVGFGLFMPLAGMIGHIRVKLRKLSDMAKAPVCLTITEDGLVVRSAIGSSELVWKTITEAWQYPQYWVLLSGEQFLMTVPLSELDNRERASIREAFERAKVKMS